MPRERWTPHAAPRVAAPIQQSAKGFPTHPRTFAEAGKPSIPCWAPRCYKERALAFDSLHQFAFGSGVVSVCASHETAAMAPKKRSNPAADASNAIGPCMWGSRFAIPLQGCQGHGSERASLDDARELVNDMHHFMDVYLPGDDFFMHLLGTGLLAGRLSKEWRSQGLDGPVVIVGAYKIRQPHIDALAHVSAEGSSPIVGRLARLTVELDPSRRVKECTEALEALRHGRRDPACTPDMEALRQEHRAWISVGASPRALDYNMCRRVAKATSAKSELEEKHGSSDPAQWRWGDGTACADVFAADAAKREHEALVASIATLQKLCDDITAAEEARSSDQGVSESFAARERSRSPRQEPANISDA